MKPVLKYTMLFALGAVTLATAQKKANEYDDLLIAKLGPEEAAQLDAIDGQWKRPVYSNPDPKYAEDWSEITSYKIPEWLIDAKFGMYTHWGVYSVPAFRGNTYVRDMYTPTSKKGKPRKDNELTYPHHVETYGDPTEFGYTDFVPMFKAEKYKGEDFVKLMQDTGAKFGGLGVVHHDGFLMWDSEINRWNVGNMGPKRDIYGEFVDAARKADFKTVATFHHARTYNFAFKDFNEEFYTDEQKANLDLLNPENADFFWGMPNGDKTVQDFAAEWRAKILEVTEKYSPDLLWFDGVNRTLPNSPENYVVEVLKDYLKKGTDSGKDPVLCNKLPGGDRQNYCHFNFPENTGIRCYEGNRNMPPDAGEYWLTDRAISYPWSYTHDKAYNLGADIHVRAICDQTARGGIYLLSLTPMASGEIHPKEKAICYGIGDWLKENGEAIYNTRRWKIPAEGPVTSWKLIEKREGIMWDYKKPDQDGAYRFTQSKDGKTVYAIMMTWPKNGETVIKSLKKGSEYRPENIKSVELIGSKAKLEWKQTAKGLEINLPAKKPCDYAYAFKIN